MAMMKLSERSLAPFLDEEPDLYTARGIARTVSHMRPYLRCARSMVMMWMTWTAVSRESIV